MKIISISTDRKVFEMNSAIRERIIEYGKLFDELSVIVFTLSSHEYESSEKISSNVTVYPTNSSNKLSYISDAYRMGKVLIVKSKSAEQKSVISVQDPFETGIVGMLLKLSYGLPLQIQVHTDFFNFPYITHSVLNAIRIFLAHLTLPFANQVRVVSKKVFVSVSNLSPKIELLPIYTNIERIPNRNLTSHFNVLSVSRLEGEKDLQTAIKAFALHLKSYPNSTYTIVGDGSEKNKLEILCKNLGVENKVKFAGWRENLGEFFQSANVYISTSLYEGYGMSLVEAGSYGLSVITSNTGLAGDFFIDKQSALVCKQRDVNEFANALNLIASDPTFAQKIGEAAKKIINEKHIEKTEYLARYKLLIEHIQNEKLSNNILINFINYLESIFVNVRVVRFVAAGSTAAISQLVLLYILTDIIGLWYLASSIIAFCIAVLISFVLHKFWTFKDRVIKGIFGQFAAFFGVAVFGLVFNTVLMFLWVDLIHLWYIYAQVITGLLVMFSNFTLYKFVVFRNK